MRCGWPSPWPATGPVRTSKASGSTTVDQAPSRGWIRMREGGGARWWFKRCRVCDDQPCQPNPPLSCAVMSTVWSSRRLRMLASVLGSLLTKPLFTSTANAASKEGAACLPLALLASLDQRGGVWRLGI
jgi:hypothetical protein